MSKKIIIVVSMIFTIIIMAQTANAKPVSAQKALENARQFVEKNKFCNHLIESLDSNNIQLVYTTNAIEESNGISKTEVSDESTTENPACYVYNYGNGKGFVIVAGDDSMQPILGYSDEGKSFSKENMPDAIKDWFAWISEVAGYARQSNSAEYTFSNKNESTTVSVVSPLLGSIAYNQDTPYNLYCPSVNGKRCYTGCVATALVQVMRYWQWPTDYCKGNINYTTHTLGINISKDLSKVKFDWANMLTSYPTNGSYSTTQANAVAELMYSCGVATGMDYTTSGSSPLSDADWINVLHDNFGYSKGLTLWMTDLSYSDLNYINTLLSTELSQGRPMVCIGVSPEGVNHAFVCDGSSSNGLYHFNLGWGGYDNGYYAVTGISTSYNFFLKSVLYNIEKQSSSVSINGLNYILNESTNTASVTYKSDDTKSNATYVTGNLKIPATIEKDGKIFTVTSIDACAFDSCVNLSSVILPTTITNIGNKAFRNCSQMDSISLSQSLKDIGYEAFIGCTNLKKINIPASVELIEDKAFTKCSNLTAINVSNGNNSYISVDGILYSKDKSKLICIPIGKSGIANIEDGVKTINGYAAYCCTNLSGVTIPEGVESIGPNAFFFCYNISNLRLPSSLIRLGSLSISNCIGFKKIIIPNGVKKIEFAALFYDINLESLTIPSSVTTIEGSAFQGCQKLKNVYVYSSSPIALGNDAFNNANIANCTLHVISGTKAAYQSAIQWKDFGTIIDDLSADINEVKDNEHSSKIGEICYNLNGTEIKEPQCGFYIKVIKFADGSRKVAKVLKQ
ncbi:MAG: C10 family peptidase [Muribaculaceae bacterium]|jgi:hypothetical protein|nr:C10 family peptidase [Muribaculaceae bacterium]